MLTTNAGNAEKFILKNSIEMRHVECITFRLVITSSIVVYRTTCSFQQRKEGRNQDKILMIDMETPIVSNYHYNDFSEEHLEGLTALINTFRGDELERRSEDNAGSMLLSQRTYQDVGLLKW